MSVYTDCVPPISAEDYEGLKASIRKEKRVFMPIVVDEYGVDIDGGNRKRIWGELKAEGIDVADLQFQVVPGLTDAEKRSLARSLNKNRRHLTPEQRRVMVADELRENPQKSDRQIASTVGVDHKTVGTVRGRLERTGEIPQLDRTVGADGKERPSTRPAPSTPAPTSEPTSASKPVAPIFANGRQLEKVKVLAEAGRIDDVAENGGVDGAYRQMRREQRREATFARQDVEVSAISPAVAASIPDVADSIPETAATPAFPSNKYAIILADPPWFFNDRRNGNTRFSGGARAHYPVMKTEEICALPVADIATTDCMLFLWCCWPTMEDAFRVIQAWGFRYVTCAFNWIKQNEDGSPFFGIGYYTKSNSEVCLLAVRGTPWTCSNSVAQVVMSRRQEHSRKPAEVRDRIVQLCGDRPRIELFARQAAPGWDCWGLEAPEAGGEEADDCPADLPAPFPVDAPWLATFEATRAEVLAPEPAAHPHVHVHVYRVREDGTTCRECGKAAPVDGTPDDGLPVWPPTPEEVRS